MPHPWRDFVKKYKAEHPELSYRDVLQQAGVEYRGGAAKPIRPAKVKKVKAKKVKGLVVEVDPMPVLADSGVFMGGANVTRVSESDDPTNKMNFDQAQNYLAGVAQPTSLDGYIEVSDKETSVISGTGLSEEDIEVDVEVLRAACMACEHMGEHCPRCGIKAMGGSGLLSAVKKSAKKVGSAAKKAALGALMAYGLALVAVGGVAALDRVCPKCTEPVNAALWEVVKTSIKNQIQQGTGLFSKLKKATKAAAKATKEIGKAAVKVGTAPIRAEIEVKKAATLAARNLLRKATGATPLFAGESHYINAAYTGPGTQIEKRLARGDPPWDGIDAASMRHDIAYNRIFKIKDEVERQKQIREADLTALKEYKEALKADPTTAPHFAAAYGGIATKIKAEDNKLSKPAVKALVGKYYGSRDEFNKG